MPSAAKIARQKQAKKRVWFSSAWPRMYPMPYRAVGIQSPLATRAYSIPRGSTSKARGTPAITSKLANPGRAPACTWGRMEYTTEKVTRVNSTMTPSRTLGQRPRHRVTSAPRAGSAMATATAVSTFME